MFWTMVVTKITKRKRKRPDWLVDDYPVLDLTEDGGESESMSMSEFESSEEGKKNSLKLESSSFDRETLSDDQDERKLLSFSSAKASPVVKYTRKPRPSGQDNDDESVEYDSCGSVVAFVLDFVPRNGHSCAGGGFQCVHGQIPTITELGNQTKSQIVLPVRNIQPATKVNLLYLKFSAQAVEVRGGDNKESLVHEWPLENIVGIGTRYCSDWEEDTRAFVTVRVSVPLSSLSGSSNKIDEYVLELSKFRDSVFDISKLSPIYGGIIEQLKKEDVDETLRTIEMQNSPRCTSLFTSSSEEEDVEETARTIEMPNSQACTSLFTSSSEELDEAIAAFKVLVYPQGDPDAVTITQKDLKILKPFVFLNDTIIDFYIKYLQQTIVSSEKLKTLHFFNSFFFSKLAEADTGDLAAFERVKKWTRKVNVFEKDFVYIPVNQSLHWSLIIICHPGHMWGDSTINGSSDGDACILHLDSMEGCHRGVEGHIKNYLLQEWLERNNDPDDRAYAESFFSEMPFRYSKVPQQDNNCDCGLFLLHYVELFLKTAPSIYRMKRQSSPSTEFLRRNWFKPSEASEKRLVIQKLILELSQGRSLEISRDYSEIKENAPNRVFPAGEEVTRPLSMSMSADKQSAAPSTTTLDRVHSDSPHHLKEPLIENRSPSRSEEVELKDDSSRAVSSDRQEKHAKVQHVDVSTEDREFDDRCRGLHYIGSDQSKVSYESGTDQSSAHILVVNDDLKSGPEAVILPDDETWNYEKCPVPRLPLQVKPLQVPRLLDEQVNLYYQPPAVVVDLGTQDGPETNDGPSCSLSNEDARESQKPYTQLEFDSILSPENDDEMYESSYLDAKQKRATSNLQSVEHVRSSSVLQSPESLDSLLGDNFKEDAHIDEGGRRPVRFRNKTSPSGRCSELNMQGALKCGQRKHTEDRVLTQKDSNQPYGFTVCREEVQEIQDLSSDDSSDSSKRWDFKERSREVNVKRPSLETGQRVTRSLTQIYRGLTVSAEKQTQINALEDLVRLKNSKKR